MTWQDKRIASREIVKRAIMDLEPYAVVMMVSGGDDSLTAYHVARHLGIKIDAICHVVTGTGIPQTTEFVRGFAEQSMHRYLEHDAGDTYERYVMRKGFFGRGLIAHSFAYHKLKAEGFRKLISATFRQGQSGRKVVMLNGARRSESENRMFTMKEAIQQEHKNSPNWWVNIINDWDKTECRAFLAEYDIKRNPVSCKLRRSGECMCGTMQSALERKEAAYHYPEWGRWIDDLEARVFAKHHWGWGQNTPEWFKQEKQGQQRLFDFTPMCVSCSKTNPAEKIQKPTA